MKINFPVNLNFRTTAHQSDNNEQNLSESMNNECFGRKEKVWRLIERRDETFGVDLIDSIKTNCGKIVAAELIKSNVACSLHETSKRQQFN